MRGDGVPLVLGLHQFLEDQLVDTAVVHIHDLGLESTHLQHLALVRDARDLVQNQAGDGVEAFMLAEVFAQGVGKVIKVGLAVHQPGAVRALMDPGLLFVMALATIAMFRLTGQSEFLYWQF